MIKNLFKFIVLLFLIFFLIVFNLIRSKIHSALIRSLILGFIVLNLFIFLLKYIKEKSILKDAHWINDLSIFVLTVGKNEGERIIRIVKTFMSFPENVKMVYFDDDSTDNSFEKLKELEKEYKNRLFIRRLERDERLLHPKGLGIEKAIAEYDADIYFIMDADTYIDFETFKQAIFVMKKLNLNVIHLTRRNDEKNTISYRMADSEEILQSWVNIVGLQRIIFPGSSVLIKGKVAKLLKYKEKTFSDDNEFGRQLRKSGYKWIYFASLQTHEKAPDTVRNLFKQRKNWYKVGMVHFFYYEFSVSILITIISMMGWLLLFNPSSVYGLIMYPMLLNGLIMEIIANMIIGRKNLLNSLLDTLLYIPLFLTTNFVYTLYFTILAPFYSKRISFSKNT